MAELVSQDYKEPNDNKGSRRKPQVKDLRSGVLSGQYHLRGSLLVIQDARDSVSGFIAFGNSIDTIPQDETPTPVTATGVLQNYEGITVWRTGVLQVAIRGSDGITAGGGVVLLDVDGLTLDDANTDSALVKWKSGTNLTGAMGTYSTAGVAKLTLDVNTDGAFTDGKFHVNVYDEDADTALFRLVADKANGNYATFGSDSTLLGMTINGQSRPDATLDIRGHYCITDGVTAPATVAGKALIYVDTADGDLKVKFGDGTTKTLATDT